jgi:hypothetical protein
VRPNLALRSNWARNALKADVFFEQTAYAKLTNENTSAYGVGGYGIIDAAHDTQIQVNFGAAHQAESLTNLSSFRGANKPATYDQFDLGLVVNHSFNKLTVTANASVDRHTFQTLNVNGVAIDQSYRDVTQVTLGGSANYPLNSEVGLIFSGQYDRSRYDFGPGSIGFLPGLALDRASSGVRLRGGFTLQLSNLIFGTIQAGYYHRNYRDARLLNPSGLDLSADVLWNVTPLTSIKLHAARSVQDSSSTVVAGNTYLDFSLGVNHELYRYLLLSSDVAFTHYTPNGPGFAGNQFAIGGSVRYLVNRHFTLTGSLRQSQRTTLDDFSRYRALLGQVSLRFAL